MSSVSDRNLPFFLAAAALAISSQIVNPTSDNKDDVVKSKDDMPARKQSSATDMPPPVDAAEARERVEQEMEEERFARIERGFAQPYEGARPALIIVMVSFAYGFARQQGWGLYGPGAHSLRLGMSSGSCFVVSFFSFIDYLPSSRSLTCLSAERPRRPHSGKSTIGISLADAFNIPFIDGDSLHPKSNVDKMSAGTPLDDNDRLPWLALIRATAERVCREEWVTKEQGLFGVLHEQDGNLNRDVEDLAELADWEFGEGWKWKGNLKKKTDESLGVPRGGLRRPAVVIACSALKKWYRDILRGHYPVEMPVSDISGEDTEEVSSAPFHCVFRMHRSQSDQAILHMTCRFPPSRR
jgi:gluconate kinase